MRAKRRTEKEPYDMIIECRQSGCIHGASDWNFRSANHESSKSNTFGTNMKTSRMYFMLDNISVVDDIYIVCGYTDMKKQIDGDGSKQFF